MVTVVAPPSPPPTRPPVKWAQSVPGTPEAVRAGLVLAVARRGLGVAVTALAQEAGYSRSFVGQVERGFLAASPEALGRLFTALGLLSAQRVAAADLEARRGSSDD